MTSDERKHELEEMFQKIEGSKEFKEFLKKFKTTELLNMDYPEWVQEKFWEEIENDMFDRLGLYSYTDIRKSVLIDWGSNDSLEAKISELQLQNEAFKTRAEKMEKRFKEIVQVLSKMDDKLNIAEVLELMEDDKETSE